MNTDNDKPDIKALERFRTLRDKRRQLMALEPKEAMEHILQDPQSVALVHSFPEQDFYFLIHDIGPEDAGVLFNRNELLGRAAGGAAPPAWRG